MTGLTSTAEHRQSRRAIAAHFAGRASTRAEAAMRTHLIDCPSCKEHYERQAIWSRFVPGAPAARERIARGLGIETRRRWSRPLLLAGLALPAAVALMLVVGPPLTPSAHRTAEGSDAPLAYWPRGAAPAAAEPAPSIWTYRFAADGSASRVGPRIAPSDELAFAYANPARKAYLMIFGVDEHRHVYWFHPGWPDGRPAPASVAAHAGPGPHELPEAVRHPLDGRALTVFALFSDRAIAATAVEDLVRVAPTAGALRGLQRGVLIVERALEVRP